MGDLIMQLIPVALGVVLSRLPRVNGVAYLVGWIVGLVGVLALCLWLFGTLPIAVPVVWLLIAGTARSPTSLLSGRGSPATRTC